MKKKKVLITSGPGSCECATHLIYIDYVIIDYVIMWYFSMKLIFSCSLFFQCQTAALDELFNNPQECFRRYQTAQILLHSLAQQSRNSKDKESLNKCKSA